MDTIEHFQRAQIRTTSTMRRVACLIVLVVTAVSALLAAPASAHAALVSMSPEADSTLQSPPSEVRLEFNEGISTTAQGIRLFDPSGRELQGVEVTSENSTITAGLPDLTTDGSYTVAWQAVSADGHPIRGAYLFHLREATLTEPVDTGASGVPPAAAVLRAAGAVLALLGLVAVFGHLLGVGARTSPDTKLPAWVRVRWMAVSWGTIAMFLGAMAIVGASVSESFTVTLDTMSGRVCFAAMLLALVGLVVSLIPGVRRAEPVLAVLTLAAVALQGHAVSLPPVALSASLTAAHVIAAMTWGVGLFWVDHRSRTAERSQVRSDVERLSPFAMGAVVVLALTGAVLVFDRVPLDQLLSSTYGRLGLVKLALLAATVIVAFRNRAVVTPDIEGPLDPDADADAGLDPDAEEMSEGAVGRLRSGIRVEMVLLAVALIAGAALSQISPPETDGSAAGGMFSERVAFGEGEVELTIEPGERGTNEVHVIALGDDGRLMADIEDLALSMTLASEDVGPLQPEMQFITSGHSVSYADFPLAGEWDVEVTGRIGKFQAVSGSFTVPIGERG